MSEPPKLLLVDDEPGLRAAVQAYLEDDNEFSVQVAASADEAWELMEKSPPDLVISDIMMPQVSGYEFLNRLRAEPRFQTLPVIFLTARGMTADRIVGYEAGCDAYLPKPFEPEELVAIVRNLLTRRNAVVSTDSDDTKLEKIERGIDEILGKLGGASGLPQTFAATEIELTPREQSVLDLVAKGLMNKEIARQLNTSVRNVEKYVSRLFNKTGTYSRTELVRFALERGLTH